MPLYDYHCDTCTYSEERLVRQSGDIVEEMLCPVCRHNEMAGHLIRQVGSSTPIFRGQNWAKDNYGLKAGRSNGNK